MQGRNIMQRTIQGNRERERDRERERKRVERNWRN
uniref:Uncharacterized protein n=1 Tax=Anguilla anguilla TaxID=7936 RepID=A0A0E9VI81_ANGAN